jgi:hypothetical protein
MRLTRLAFLALLFGTIPLLAGCGGGKDKLVGKWKVVSMTDKDGKEEKAPPGADAALIEFTADGNMKLVMDLSGLPPEIRAKMEQDKETAAKMQGGVPLAKYTVSGDTIEITASDKGGRGFFGTKEKEKGKFKIEGDTLTISGDDGTLKFTRAK